MLCETSVLIPCYRFLALCAGLDIHTSLSEERVLTIVVSLQLRRTRMTIFHSRISISETGFPVLIGAHQILERRTEQLSPVYLLATLLEIELDIVRVSELVEALLFLVLLSTFPTLAVCPELITFLEVLGVDLFLQLGQLNQLLRVLHFHVVLVESGTEDHVVHSAFGLAHAVIGGILERLALTELQSGLESVATFRIVVHLDTQQRCQFIVCVHFTTFFGVFVLTVNELVAALLEVAAFYEFLQLKILRQLRRFLNLPIAFNTLLEVFNGLLIRIRREHFAG